MISEQQIKIENELLVVPVPDKTETYQPVANRDLLNIVHDTLYNAGYEITNKRYSVSKDRTRVIGYYALRHIEGIQDDAMSQMLAFRNSYDKSMAVGAAAGAEVFICGNGMVVGEHTFKRKHRSEGLLSDIAEYFVDAVANLEQTFRQAVEFRNTLQAIELSQSVINEIYGSWALTEFLPHKEMLKIKEQINNPGFDDFRQRNAWSFYNHCTYAIKETRPDIAEKMQGKVKRYFEQGVEVWQ